MKRNPSRTLRLDKTAGVDGNQVRAELRKGNLSIDMYINDQFVATIYNTGQVHLIFQDIPAFDFSLGLAPNGGLLHRIKKGE